MKMNNHGQSLITFVLVLPLLALLIAFFVDSSLSIMEKNKLDGIITSNMEEALKKEIRDENKIIGAIKNNSDMDIVVNVIEDELRIIVKSKKQSVFAKLLKFSYYDLNFNYCGNYIDKKINKECG